MFNVLVKLLTVHWKLYTNYSLITIGIAGEIPPSVGMTWIWEIRCVRQGWEKNLLWILWMKNQEKEGLLRLYVDNRCVLFFVLDRADRRISCGYYKWRVRRRRGYCVSTLTYTIYIMPKAQLSWKPWTKLGI